MGALDTLNATNASGQVTNIADNAVQSGDLASGVVNNSTITITAGDALTGGGTLTTNQGSNSTITVNHQDTSSQGSSNNSGTTFIQDITLDTYGHVTGIGTASAGGSGNNTSTTAVGAYAMVAATNPTNTNVGTGTSFAGNSSTYRYGGVTAGVNNYSFSLSGAAATMSVGANIPAGTWHFRGSGGTNTGRCTLCQRTA